jgi:hypothetical protein
LIALVVWFGLCLLAGAAFSRALTVDLELTELRTRVSKLERPGFILPPPLPAELPEDWRLTTLRRR